MSVVMLQTMGTPYRVVAPPCAECKCLILRLGACALGERTPSHEPPRSRDARSRCQSQRWPATAEGGPARTWRAILGGSLRRRYPSDRERSKEKVIRGDGSQRRAI